MDPAMGPLTIQLDPLAIVSSIVYTQSSLHNSKYWRGKKHLFLNVVFKLLEQRCNIYSILFTLIDILHVSKKFDNTVVRRGQTSNIQVNGKKMSANTTETNSGQRKRINAENFITFSLHQYDVILS